MDNGTMRQEQQTPKGPILKIPARRTAWRTAFFGAGPADIGHWFAIGIGIAAVCALAGLFGLNFRKPISLYGDSTEILMTAKGLLKWSQFYTNADIGFPSYFSHLAYPFSDYSQRAILFILARICRNVFVIHCLFYVCDIILIFLSAYWVIWIYVRDKIYAVAGGILFVFIPYLAVRTTGHDYLAAYYCVPWAFFLFHHIAEQQSTGSIVTGLKLFTRPAVWLSLMVVALSGIYYTAFGLLFLCFASTLWSLRRRSPIFLGLAVIATAIIVAILLVGAIPMLAYLRQEELVTPVRYWTEQPWFAVRFSDLLWTLKQSISNVPKFDVYWTYRAAVPAYEGFDFWPGIALSLIAIASIVCLPANIGGWADGSPMKSNNVVSFQKDATGVMLAFMIFSLLVAVPFGLGFLFNLLVAPEIRAQNRIGPFLVLFLLFPRSSCFSSRFPASKTGCRLAWVDVG
jgi:phosphoglycerol transferase